MLDDVSLNICLKFHTLTELSSCFDVNVVEARANPDNDAKAFKLFQVISGQSDGVVEQGSHSLI